MKGGGGPEGVLYSADTLRGAPPAWAHESIVAVLPRRDARRK